MSADVPRPFLIKKDSDGVFRLTVRDVRFNSQGYPIVTSTLQPDQFATLGAAKAFARDNFDAKAGQYASK